MEQPQAVPAAGRGRRRRDWPGLWKIPLFIACLLPLAALVVAGVRNGLGPDPAKYVVDVCGIWALRLLWACLAMTPARLLSARVPWLRYRRMLGLFAFFYAALHVLAYVFLLFGAQWAELLTEITQRPYIIAGAAAFVLLLPLAITSTRGWQRRLGRRWSRLHKLIYLSALLALLHFTWLKKLGLESTWPYALLLVVLFGMRVVAWRRRRSSK
jgi:sulfoxide reductase heme-binding subunit YedZ